MEIFKWSPLKASYRITTSSDYQEQEYDNGAIQLINYLNFESSLYSVSFTLKKNNASELIKFLNNHKGGKPFQFKEPLSGNLLSVYLVDGYNVSLIGGNYVTIATQFKNRGL